MTALLSIADTGATELALLSAHAKQHGCSTGATGTTGTGQTVTLQKLLAEFSRSGLATGPRGGRHAVRVDAFAKSAARSVGGANAREITRGVMGSLLGDRR